MNKQEKHSARLAKQKAKKVKGFQDDAMIKKILRISAQQTLCSPGKDSLTFEQEKYMESWKEHFIY